MKNNLNKADVRNFFEIHLFCCLNKKAGIKEPNSCGGKGAEELFEEFKKRCMAANINNIRINKSGCLGRCALGKVLVIYPEGVWYHYDNMEDLQEILDHHLINKNIVDRLVLKNNQFNLL